MLRATSLLLLCLFGSTEAAYDLGLRLTYPFASTSCSETDSSSYIKHLTWSVYGSRRNLSETSETSEPSARELSLIAYCTARCAGFPSGQCHMVYGECVPGWDDRRNLRGEASGSASEPQPTASAVVRPSKESRELFIDYGDHDVPMMERLGLQSECLKLKSSLESTMSTDVESSYSMGSCSDFFHQMVNIECVVFKVNG